MAPSMKQLSEFLERGTFEFSARFFVWDEQIVLKTSNSKTWLAVFHYLTKFFPFSNPLNDTITHLNHLASKRMRGSNKISSRRLRIEQQFFTVFQKSLLPELHKFFTVPKLHNLYSDKGDGPDLEANGLLASLIHFLLQILESEGDPFQDLQKELTFLLTFLGDVPFRNTEAEEVKNLLLELEAVANEAGGFIFSRVVTAPRIKICNFSAGMDVFLRNIEVLNVKIREHCIKFANRPGYFSTPNGSSVAVDSLFVVDNLVEDLEKLELSDDVKDQAKTLHEELIAMQSFLHDTYKAYQNKDVDELKECNVQITDVACELEYLINSFVVGNVPVWYLSLRISYVIEKFQIIGKGLEEIKKNVNSIRVVGTQKEFMKDEPLSQTAATNTFTIDDELVGFEDERIKILGKLMGESESLQIISIFGMPGLGKTTLAKKLYGERSIVEYFDRRAWCVVSQTYKMRKVLIDLLMSLSSGLSKENILKMEGDSLALEIHKSLKGRRYLIVLDDVWDQEVWDHLRRYFPDDGNGSRILFTTRIRDIAPSGSIIHPLPLLSKDQCWELLEKKVFYKETCPQELRDVGRRIALNCRGLPLVVVVIAGILANMEKEERVWENVEKSLYSYISSTDPDNYLKILELSYKHLPCHLKWCFLYLGAFPEDTEIPVRTLKWLWIAEGFIRKREERNEEDIAEEYLMDLIGRSLVLIGKNRSTGGVKTCSIHDLLRDMCIRKANEENFMQQVEDYLSVYTKHHRLCIHSVSLAYSRPFSLHCRSFLGYLSDPVSCFSRMKLLRILGVEPVNDARYILELNRIYLLVHLRYLVVNQMPEPMALAKLVNLEVLRVYGQETSIHVSPVLLKMVKLRHLRLRAYSKFEKGCEDSSKMNNLQTFSFITIDEAKDVEVLRRSPHLRNLKCRCTNESLFPNLNFLTVLESLTMMFKVGYVGDFAEIKFPLTIKKLTLSGIFLPWEEISRIGRLPNLQVLTLETDSFFGDEWETREDEFQELRILKISNLNLRQWIASNEHFPKLEHLVLFNCLKLQNIPTEIGEIATMRTIHVDSCGKGVEASALQIREEQREYGNEDLQVVISSTKENIRVCFIAYTAALKFIGRRV